MMEDHESRMAARLVLGINEEVELGREGWAQTTSWWKRRTLGCFDGGLYSRSLVACSSTGRSTVFAAV